MANGNSGACPNAPPSADGVDLSRLWVWPAPPPLPWMLSPYPATLFDCTCYPAALGIIAAYGTKAALVDIAGAGYPPMQPSSGSTPYTGNWSPSALSAANWQVYVSAMPSPTCPTSPPSGVTPPPGGPIPPPGIGGTGSSSTGSGQSSPSAGGPVAGPPPAPPPSPPAATGNDCCTWCVPTPSGPVQCLTDPAAQCPSTPLTPDQVAAMTGVTGSTLTLNQPCPPTSTFQPPPPQPPPPAPPPPPSSQDGAGIAPQQCCTLIPPPGYGIRNVVTDNAVCAGVAAGTASVPAGFQAIFTRCPPGQSPIVSPGGKVISPGFPQPTSPLSSPPGMGGRTAAPMASPPPPPAAPLESGQQANISVNGTSYCPCG